MRIRRKEYDKVTNVTINGRSYSISKEYISYSYIRNICGMPLSSITAYKSIITYKCAYESGIMRDGEELKVVDNMVINCFRR